MYLKQLVKSNKTIFSLDDLQKIWLVENRAYLRLIVSRLCKKNEIARVSRSLYALNKEYDLFELANKIKVPSYVSLETVLQKEGVVFQDYERTIFSISNNSLTKKINDLDFSYSKIKEEILFNPLGIKRSKQANLATVERALCDRIYLSPNYYFDNLRPINQEELLKISQIYNSRVQKEVKNLIKAKNNQ